MDERHRNEVNQQYPQFQALKLLRNAESLKNKAAKNLPLAVLLSVESYRLNPTPEADVLMRSGLLLCSSLACVEDGGSGKRSTINSNGRRVAISDQSGLKVLESLDGRSWRTLLTDSQNNGMQVLKFSLDGEYLAVWESTYETFITSEKEGNVKIWKIADQEMVLEAFYKGSVDSIEFSTNGRYMAVSGFGRSILLVNLSNKKVKYLEHEVACASPIAFSSDSDIFLGCLTGGEFTFRGDNEIWVWQTSNWKCVQHYKIHDEIKGIQFSENSECILAYSNFSRTGNIFAWKVRQILGRCRLQQIFETMGYINGFAFDPECWWKFVTANDDCNVQIWYLLRIKRRYHASNAFLGKHDDTVNAVSYAPSNPVISGFHNVTSFASCSKDQTGRQWDGKKEIGRAIHKCSVDSVQISGDGKYLISITEDQGVYTWELNNWNPLDNNDPNKLSGEDLVLELKKRVGRNLTVEEWNEYFPGEPYRQTFDLQR